MNFDLKEISDSVFDYINKTEVYGGIDYTTFGKQIEEAICEALIGYFNKKNMLKSHKIAPTKNDFPDFELNKEFAFEIKAAWNKSNPENDMGTLNSWTKKLQKYNDNIYYIFVKYNCGDDDTVIGIDNIHVDKVYNLIGHNSDGYLKYREKDGNLRPKSWSDFDTNKSYVKNYSDFKKQLDETDDYRAYRIIYKKLTQLKDNEILMEKLKKEFFINK